MSASKAPTKRRNDSQLLKNTDTTETTDTTVESINRKTKVEPEVYPQVPLKKVAILGATGIMLFFLSSVHIGNLELYFLRTISFGLMTFIALSYAVNISKYPKAPHNQPKPGVIKKSKAFLGKHINTKGEDKPLSMTKWARFGRWNAKVRRKIGYWLRRSNRLTMVWLIVVCGVLATLYTAFASIYPMLKQLGLF